MTEVPESERLFMQGCVLGDQTHDQRGWNERLHEQQPPAVRVAAGVLASHFGGNELYAAFIAWELHNAGMLVMPEKLPVWEEIR